MDNTWIKLYRKAMEHDVFQDESAWRVWTWILMSVDYETGEMTFGRFKDAEALNMSPSKFRHIIDRLRGKYDLIETTNNHSHTRLKIKNWHKYQAQTDSIVDNSKTGPDLRPQERPQVETETRPQKKTEEIPQQRQYNDSELQLGPQERPQAITDLGPQPEATNKATIQEYKNNKEIKNNINTSSYEEGQQSTVEPLGLFDEETHEKSKEPIKTSSEPIEGELVDLKKVEPVKKRSEPNPDGSYGRQDINEVRAYFLEKMGISRESCTRQDSGIWWNNLLKSVKNAENKVDSVKSLIDLASDNSVHLRTTSPKDLYYNIPKLELMRNNKKVKIGGLHNSSSNGVRIGGYYAN